MNFINNKTMHSVNMHFFGVQLKKKEAYISSVMPVKFVFLPCI